MKLQTAVKPRQDIASGLTESRRAAMPEHTVVVHEWIASRAGSEKVFEMLAGAWPDADLFALSMNREVPMDLQGRTVHTTFLDSPPLRDRRALTLPLMPLAWRLVGKPTYDRVITSHHAFAASNRLTKLGGSHFVYVHTPARYL